MADTQPRQHDSTAALSAQQLAELLALGLDGLTPTPAAATEADCLAALLDSVVAEGVTIRRCLESPDADVALIERIHRDAKQLARSAESEPRRAAATTVYFAAIAHATLHARRALSRQSPEQLAASLADIRDREGMPGFLRAVFTAALEAQGGDPEAPACGEPAEPRR